MSELLAACELRDAEARLRVRLKLPKQQWALLAQLLVELAPTPARMREALEGLSRNPGGKILDVQMSHLRRSLRGTAEVSTLRSSLGQPAVGYALDAEGRARLNAIARGQERGLAR